MTGGTQYVVMMIAASLLWIAILAVAAWEPQRRPARPSFGPLCLCGCGRPIEKHNPMRARLVALIGRHL